MSCGACEKVRRILPRPMANSLRTLEERMDAEKQLKKERKRLSAAFLISSMVPPNKPKGE